MGKFESPGGDVELSRKRKKQLRKLQKQANQLWETQQVILGQASDVAREARKQLGHYSREQVAPAVRDGYQKYAAPYVDKGVSASRTALQKGVIPVAGAVVGGALSVWDVANEARERVAAGRGVDLAQAGKKYQKKAGAYGKQATKQLSKKLDKALPEPKSGLGAGGIIAIILGVAAAAGVAYAAWQTLRADDELWVADDPIASPDAS